MVGGGSVAGHDAPWYRAAAAGSVLLVNITLRGITGCNRLQIVNKNLFNVKALNPSPLGVK